MDPDRENNRLYPTECDQRSETFFICSPKTHNRIGWVSFSIVFWKYPVACVFAEIFFHFKLQCNNIVNTYGFVKTCAVFLYF